jgi:adenylate cyclase
MEDAIINILIVNSSQSEAEVLSHSIKKPGHNVIVVESTLAAERVIAKIELAIILISSEISDINWPSFISNTNHKNSYKECFIIVTGSFSDTPFLDKLFEIGISDFIEKPFSKIKIDAKINTFKRLYHKNKTIVNLLENILPHRVLTEFSQHQKYTPKKHKNCTIIFTDFIGFSSKALDYKPLELLKMLDYYFSSFDAIFEKYQIEKIKTIGDSYMAVGGLHAGKKHFEISMALAAIEIKLFIEHDIAKRKAKKQDFWEIRIGIHTGDLIAGVIGQKKFAFDVWGDSVNIAAMCEQRAQPNQINVSETFKSKIEQYFDFTDRGAVDIKHGRKIRMYTLNKIKSAYSESKIGTLPNQKIRKLANLPIINFEGIRTYVLDTLKADLNPNLTYHSITHTINVEKAVSKYSKLEGISAKELILLRTAALFHDTGFLTDYQQNEAFAVNFLRSTAPQYGFTTEDVNFMSDIILATSKNVSPSNLFEQIICDADHDYLGRKDYHLTAANLRSELSLFGTELTDEEWLQKQISYLEFEHVYYTNSARNIRQEGKEKRIIELKAMLASLHFKK